MITARLRKGHGVIQRDIMTMPGVSVFSKAVYCLLVSYAGERDTCYPSIVTIGENLELSKPTILKAIRELEINQLVIITKVKSNNGYRNNVYEPMFLLQDSSVNVVDLGGKGDLPSSVNVVDPKNNIIKNNIEEDLNINTESHSENSVSIDKSKKTSKAKPENECYRQIVDFWLKEFQTDFTFNGTSGKKVMSIITKFKTLLKNEGRQITQEAVVNAFIYMCKHLPDYYKNKDLPTIDSKFNEIILEIKNKNNGKQTGKQSTRATTAAKFSS